MTYEELIEKANEAKKVKELESALAYLLEALEISISEDLLIEIALLYDELNEYEKAIAYYEKCISLNDRNPVPYYGLGTVYDTLLRYDEAISYYKEAISLNDKYYPAYFFLANIYEENNEVNLAIYNYEQVISINPDYFYAYLNLSAIMESQNKDTEALKLLLKAKDINEENHLLHFNLGVVYRKLGDINQSIKHYERSIAISPSYPFAFLNLAILYKDDLHDLSKAIDIYSNGILLHNVAVLYYNRACAYALLKDYEKTASDLQKAFELEASLEEFMLTDVELNDYRNWKNS